MSEVKKPSRMKRATRESLPLKMQLHGTSGSGKTYTAIRIAYGLRPVGMPAEEWNVLVIDSEHRSASKYQGITEDGVKWDIFTEQVSKPYASQKLVDVIQLGVEDGANVIVVDSLTHYWQGQGGILDTIEQLKKKAGAFGEDGGGSRGISAWKTGDSLYRMIVDAFQSCPVHIIGCIRAKEVVKPVTDEKTGKTVVKKFGLEPIFRDEFRYELDIEARLNSEHIMEILKTRCPMIDGQIYEKPGQDFARTLTEWLGDADAVTRAREADAEAAMKALDALNEKLAAFLLRIADANAEGIALLSKEASGIFSKAPTSIAGQLREAFNARRVELGLVVAGASAPSTK